MKTSSSSETRFICRLTRLRQSLLGNSDAPRAGHGTRCAECQRYFAAAATLELGLRRDSSVHAMTPPLNLETRVLQAVARSARAEKPSRSPAWWGTGLVAAAALAIAAILVMRDHPKVSTEGITPGPATVVEVVPRLDLILPAAAAALTTTQNPLQSELDSVYSDARSAVRFLALNFLPTQPADPAPRPANRNRG